MCFYSYRVKALVKIGSIRNSWKQQRSSHKRILCMLSWEQEAHRLWAFSVSWTQYFFLGKNRHLYFPLFSLGVCFRNGQSQFTTSDSICTPEQERNSFWESPRNLRIPQQACGNWWLACALGCYCHFYSFMWCAVTYTYTGRKSHPHFASVCVL